MNSISSGMFFVIADQIKSDNHLPFLPLDIKDNICIPPRKVFQIMHKHEEIEFILVLENTLHIQTTMSDIIVQAGQGVFIPKNVLHILDTRGNCTCRSFLFNDRLLSPSFYSDIYESVTKITEHPTIDILLINKVDSEQDIINKLKVLNKIAFEESKGPYYDFKLLSAIYDLWYTFSSNISMDITPDIYTKKAKGERLKKYLEYIQFNYKNSITIEEIAKSGYTSISECNRIFKKYLNVTAYEYLIQYRINKSLELLKDRKYSVANISSIVGYNSPSQFTKYFKKHMGITPTEYIHSWKK